MFGRMGKLAILWGLPLLVTFNLTASVASKGGPRQSWRSDISTLKPDDIPVPIPLSLRLPFPWELTQGIWRAKKGEFQSYFSFRLIRSQGTQENQIIIRQIDAVTCDVIAMGIGKVKSNVMAADMHNMVDNRDYSLGLISFSELNVPPQMAVKPIHGKVMVLSIQPECSGNDSPIFYMGLQRAEEQRDFDCNAERDFAYPFY